MLNYCLILDSNNLINLKYSMSLTKKLLNSKLDYMLLEESVKLTLIKVFFTVTYGSCSSKSRFAECLKNQPKLTVDNFLLTAVII